ncbi:hypothetical protein [Streptomyces sp. NPDC056682]|uniref:hypothetical protein n=1 Tax=Streptomyces sp. NPDC056682 TaxID=3345909 RepID=UPI00367E4F50
MESLAGELAGAARELPSRRPVEEINIRYRPVRRAHDMAGTDGYSLTSNWFLAKVLARCIIAHRISPTQLLTSRRAHQSALKQSLGLTCQRPFWTLRT